MRHKYSLLLELGEGLPVPVDVTETSTEGGHSVTATAYKRTKQDESRYSVQTASYASVPLMRTPTPITVIAVAATAVLTTVSTTATSVSTTTSAVSATTTTVAYMDKKKLEVSRAALE
jgi:hypothetical protein